MHDAFPHSPTLHCLHLNESRSKSLPFLFQCPKQVGDLFISQRCLELTATSSLSEYYIQQSFIYDPVLQHSRLTIPHHGRLFQKDT